MLHMIPRCKGKATSSLKHYSRLLFAIVWSCLILCLSGIALAHETTAAGTFHWIDDEDYAPFISRGEDGAPVGLYRDVMVEVFKRLGIPLNAEVYPWKRAQKYVEEGRGDGMITALTEKRRARFLATDPLYIVNERVFARRDNPRIQEIMAIKSIDGLKGFKLVDTIGAGWAEENFKGLDVIWASSHSSALNLLASGRVDIYVLGKYPGLIDIRRRIAENGPYTEGFRKLVVGPHTLHQVRYSLLIRKDSPFTSIIPEFNRVLKEMRDDGSYQAILDRHLGDLGAIADKPEGR